MSGAGIGRRLAAIERAVPARSATPPPDHDAATAAAIERHLTATERDALAALWGRVGPARLPNGRLDLAVVSDDDLDALEALIRRVWDITERPRSGDGATAAPIGAPA